MPTKRPASHVHHHAFESWNALRHEGLTASSRRNLFKVGLAGIAGLSLPRLLEQRALAARSGQPTASGKSVILLWMTGGPSQIDTWDPKPDRPIENRGPFGVTRTAMPGTIICEHLPKHAAMLDRFTVIRSVDARGSNHSPNFVFQTGNTSAEGRTNREAEKYPAIASIVAKHHGANHPAMPPYVTFMKTRSHVAFAGYLGKEFDPFQGNGAARLPVVSEVGKVTGETGADIFKLPGGLDISRIHDRAQLMQDLDRMRSRLDQSGSMEALDTYHQQAVEMLLGGRAQAAFDLSREPEKVRERYGPHIWCQQALLARRLVEAGSTFVTIDLSYHTASGTWDTHGDNIPPYGGIKRGLGPLLPLFDHLQTTLVSDLEERGLLDDVLVIAMGEFGRTPIMGTQGSTDGRNHWPNIMSMTLAGGGLKHGQVIGASEADGGTIRSRPVTPGDLAATIYRYMQVPVDTTYNDDRGRPRYVVEHGEPVKELF